MNQLFTFANGTHEVRDDADSNPPFHRDFRESHVLCGTMIAKRADVNACNFNCQLKIAKCCTLQQAEAAFRDHKDEDIRDAIISSATVSAYPILTLDPIGVYESPQKVCEVLAKIGKFARKHKCFDYVPYAPCPHCCNRPLGTCNGEGCGCLYALDNSTAKDTSLCREPPIQLRSVHHATYGTERGLTNETWLSPFNASHTAAWVVHDQDKMLLNRARMLVHREFATYKDLCVAASPAKRTMLCFINAACAPREALPLLVLGFWCGECRDDIIISGDQHAIVHANNKQQQLAVLERSKLRL